MGCSCGTGGKLKKDVSWKRFFEDPSRYADAINGFGCNGEQIIKAEDIHDADTWSVGLKEPEFVRSLNGEENRRQISEKRSERMLQV